MGFKTKTPAADTETGESASTLVGSLPVEAVPRKLYEAILSAVYAHHGAGDARPAKVFAQELLDLIGTL